MDKKRATTVTVRRYERLVTVEQVADRCDLHPELVRHLTALGLIEPAGESGDLFTPEVTARVQKIVRLHRDLEIDFNGIGLVLDLLEEIDILKARLHRLGNPR